MVVFTCNACNESLKKNQVEKHYTQRCRRCEYLSCVDCGKDFWGDSYQSHVKCITEDEKYSGKNYVAKVNKGEVKQEMWIQQVQSAIQKAPRNPQLKEVLHRLEEYPNVPRKKAKFQNFLKCSLRVFNQGLQDQVWDLLMTEAQTNKSQEQNGGEVKSNSNGSLTEASEQKTSEKNTEADDEDNTKKLNKKERKEERRKKTHKAEKKDRSTDTGAEKKDRSTDTGAEKKDRSTDTGAAEGNREIIKKKGKRKQRDQEESDVEEEIQPKKKKRKGEEDVTEEPSDTAENRIEEHDNNGVVEEKKGKFNWGFTITSVLQSKGEISVKKLRKKVLAEYASYGGSKGEEKVLAVFSKKLSKLPNVKVLKDKARLVAS